MNSYEFSARHIIFAMIVLMAYFSPARAFDLGLPQTVQIHGFLSQGFTHTSDNNFLGKTDDSVSFNFREFGINGSWSIVPDLQLAMQVVYRDAGKTDNSDVRIDYGLASYNLYSTENTLINIRAGRVPTPLGFYNDTRDVASTRPGIFLPQSIYFDVNRNLALSADGGYFHVEQQTDIGDFLVDFGLALPRMDDPDFNFKVLRGSPGEMEGDLSWVGRLGYEWNGGILRLALTYADINGDYKPSKGAFLQAGSFRFNPFIVSAQFNAEDWSLTAEYALRKIRVKDFGFPANGATGQSFYVQGLYRFTEHFQGFVRYDDYIADLDDQKGLRAARPSVPNYARFAEDWTFGMRYEILPSLNISGEYHRINGTGWLSALENTGGTQQHWNMYSVLLSYDF